jgi:hypothetical protein
MANVHRLQENDNRENREQNPNAGLFMYNNDNDSNPRKETICSMIKYVCCPSLSVISFIFIISVLDIIAHIVLVSFGIDTSPTAEPITFLGPKQSILDYVLKVHASHRVAQKLKIVTKFIDLYRR